MPLTLPTALDAAVQFEVLTLARLVEITRQDGRVLRLTDADFDIVIDGNIYRSDIGFTASAMLVGLNLNQVQGLSLSIALTDDGITKKDLQTRRYTAALVVVSECDYTQPAASKFVMFKGKCGRTSFKDTGDALIDVLPLTDETVKFADEVYSASCRASLGDSRCGFPIESFVVPFTVTAVATGLTSFTINTFGPSAEGRPDIDYFSQGQLKWLTGGNAEWECDVLRGDLVTKSLTLFFPTPVRVAVGDTGKLYPGCDRLLSTCANKFANVLNFRGEPFAPQWGN
jgi:uncharacterized phage protein (TIGR02218 family)